MQEQWQWSSLFDLSIDRIVAPQKKGVDEKFENSLLCTFLTQQESVSFFLWKCYHAASRLTTAINWLDYQWSRSVCVHVCVRAWKYLTTLSFMIERFLTCLNNWSFGESAAVQWWLHNLCAAIFQVWFWVCAVFFIWFSWMIVKESKFSRNDPELSDFTVSSHSF